MDPTTCEKAKAVLWRYIDRELSARELGAVSVHLRGCEACRQIYEQQSREAKLYRLALAENPCGDEFVESFGVRWRAELDRDAVTHRRGTHRRGAHRRGAHRRGTHWRGAHRSGQRRGALASGRPLPRWFAVAAVLVIVPAAIFFTLYFLQPRVHELGRYVAHGCRVEVKFEGASQSSSQLGGSFRPGLRFEVPAGCELKVHLERAESSRASELEIVGPAIFSVDRDATPSKFLASLRSGELEARVDPLEPDESFAIVTPDAIVRVVGTRFRLRVLNSDTRLDVWEGEVVLSARGARGSSPAGEARVRPESGPFRVLPRGERPQPVEAPAAARSGEEPDASPTGRPADPAVSNLPAAGLPAAGKADGEAPRPGTAGDATRRPSMRDDLDQPAVSPRPAKDPPEDR